jgi:hypothetical protein
MLHRLVTTLALTTALTAHAAAAGEIALEGGVRVRIKTGPEVSWQGVGSFGRDAERITRPVLSRDEDSIAFEMSGGQAPLRLPRAGQTVTGAIVAADENSVLIATNRHPEGVRVPYSAIRRLDISAGKRSAASARLRGAALGLLAFGAMGVALGATGPTCERGDIVCFKRGDMMAAGGVMFGVPGAVLGAIVGPRINRELWRRAGRPGERVAVAGTFEKGPGLSLMMRF